MCDLRLLTVLALLCFSGLLQGQDSFVAEEFTRSYEAKGSPELIVRNPDGLVSIRSTESSEIKIQVKKEVWRTRNAEEAKREAEKVRVEIEQFAEQVRVNVHHPKRVFSVGDHPKVVVRLDIEAPASSGIDAGVSDGELFIEGFQGKLKLSSSDGKITATNLSGTIEISASDGEIRAEKLSGEINLRVSDGDLIANNCTGSIKVRTYDGTVRMESVNGTIEAAASDGDMKIEGKITSLLGRVSDGSMEILVAPDSVMESDWELQSSDGDIVLSLPDTFSADVQVSASDGSINTDRPIQVTGSLRGSKWTGKIGQGGHLIQIRTADGDISLR